ncbi:hypothetical protein [Streptomyces bobili]|uniref:hypothetical protein n=1 Tax=Streptomyces bobili TaxID=67280 RepID=UPI00371EA5E9
MRLCTPVSLCLAAAAVLLPVPAFAQAGPSCAGPDAGNFPLTTRLHGGPDSYRAGGGHGTWFLDLTNTTRVTCAGVHPVVVLVDSAHALQPSQSHLEFYADGRAHPVRLEVSDEHELVGALADTAEEPAEPSEPSEPSAPAEPTEPSTPFPGFTVPAGRTLTVKLRLSLTSDAVPNQVTANAAVVQRQGDDGEWVGQSNDYRFTIERGDADGDGHEGESEPAPRSTSAPSHSSSPSPSRTPDSSPSLADEAQELALTGLSSPVGVLAVTAALLATGTALVLARRRR